MLLNLGIKFLIISIFVEIFDPPIIQVIGFLISIVTFFKAFTSVSNCNPANDGRNSVILHTEACVLCEQEKASFTNKSAKLARCFEKFDSFFSSSA